MAVSANSACSAPAWEKRWLKVFAETGNVTVACRACRINRDTPYKYAARCPEFKAAWEEANEIACDALEAEARRRALEEGSDKLLEILLKAHRPQKYRETHRHELTGADGEPFKVYVAISPQDEV